MKKQYVTMRLRLQDLILLELILKNANKTDLLRRSFNPERLMIVRPKYLKLEARILAARRKILPVVAHGCHSCDNSKNTQSISE